MKPATKNMLLGASVVVLLGAAVALVATRGVSGAAKYPTGYVVHGVDLVTKEDATVHATNAETAPFLNPKTGQRTVYPWFYCAECRERFVPALVPARRGGSPKLPMIPTCPKCGTSGKRWSPDDPDQAKPVGDAPLPALTPQ